jgi:hypothetical protein
VTSWFVLGFIALVSGCDLMTAPGDAIPVQIGVAESDDGATASDGGQNAAGGADQTARPRKRSEVEAE